MSTNTITTEAPSWHPGGDWATDESSWWFVPDDLRVWYVTGPITPTEARGVPEGPEGWRDRSALPDVLPPGVTIADSAESVTVPGSMRGYDPSEAPRTWVRLRFDGDDGVRAFVHARRVASARQAAESARRAAEFHARTMVTCLCGTEVPRAGAAMLAGVTPLCAVCASVVPTVAATVAARDTLPDGRSRWEALEDALARVWTPGRGPAVTGGGPLPDVTLGLPPERRAYDLPPIPTNG